MRPKTKEKEKWRAGVYFPNKLATTKERVLCTFEVSGFYATTQELKTSLRNNIYNI